MAWEPTTMIRSENGARCSEQVFEVAWLHAASLGLTDFSASMRSASVIIPANGVIWRRSIACWHLKVEQEAFGVRY